MVGVDSTPRRLSHGIQMPPLLGLTSNTAKTAGKAIANQLVESGANIATAALMGNNVNDTLKREMEAG